MLKSFDIVMSRKKISLFIGWFLCLTPPLLLRFSTTISSIIHYGTAIYIALIFVLYRPKNLKMTNRNKRFIATVLLFLVWSSAVVFYQSEKYFLNFVKTDLMPVFEMYILLRCSISSTSNDPDEKYKDLTMLYHLMWTYLILNFFSIILFPRGVIKSQIGSSIDRANWFLGSKNNQSIYLLLIAAFICLYNTNSKKKLSGLIGILMAFFCSLVTGSSGFQFLGGSSIGIITMAFFLMAYIFVNYFGKKIIYIRFIFIYSGVCFMNYFLLSNSFMKLVSALTSMFNKNITFSGRSYVWESVKSYISYKPILGYGEPQINFLSSSLFAWSSESTYTYNLFLKIIFSFGFIGLFLMSLIFIQLPRIKDTYYTNLLIAIIGVFIIGLMNEVKFVFLFLFPFIIMLMYGDEIPDKNKITENGG